MAFDALGDESLIIMVRAYPNLYNKNLKEYRDARMREKAWKKIAEAMNSTVTEVQIRFKNLRDRYVKEKRKYEGMKRSSDVAVPPPQWKLFNLLYFLDEHIISRANDFDYRSNGFHGFNPSMKPTMDYGRMADNMHDVRVFKDELSFDPLHDETLESVVSNAMSADVTLPYQYPSAATSALTGKKRPYPSNPQPSMESVSEACKTLRAMAFSAGRSLEEGDEDLLFGMTVGAMLKKIKSRRNKKDLRVKIMSLFTEVNSGEED